MASRKQRIRKFLRGKAKKGYFSTRIKIYASEIRNFRRQGFVVEELSHKPYGDLISVEISWRHPNAKDDPPFSYADELYIIALKTLKQRNPKNN